MQSVAFFLTDTRLRNALLSSLIKMFYPLTKPLSGVVKRPKESTSIAVSLFRGAFYLSFSNALIIHRVKTKIILCN